MLLVAKYVWLLKRKSPLDFFWGIIAFWIPDALAFE